MRPCVAARARGHRSERGQRSERGSAASAVGGAVGAVGVVGAVGASAAGAQAVSTCARWPKIRGAQQGVCSRIYFQIAPSCGSDTTLDDAMRCAKLWPTETDEIGKMVDHAVTLVFGGAMPNRRAGADASNAQTLETR